MFKAMLIFLVLVFSEGFSQGDSVKCWSTHDKLKWNDFKGKVPLSESNSQFKAACASNVRVYPVMGSDSTYEYKVKTIFDRYRSWTRDTTKYMLAHEQLHFDITELYARKLRKKIKDFTGEYDSNFEKMINGLIADRAAQEKIYDNETIHGAFIEGQAKWSKKIYEELEHLKEFASTLEDCNCKP